MKTFVITFAALILINLSLSAQVKDHFSKAQFNEKEIGNLITGITSDNNGLKRSSVYFAGKYRVGETEESLMTQLKKEKDESLKRIIALSLYKIGSKEGMRLVKNLSAMESNDSTRNMYVSIVNAYDLEKGFRNVSVRD